MRIYFAGPLFTQAERAWNARIADALRAAGHAVFLPQVEVHTIAILDADAIFRVDVDGVRRADVVVAVLDGADADSGTSFECGLAYALGIPIVAVRSDFRGGGDALPGQRLATVNLMLSQAATTIITRNDPAESTDTLIAELVAILAALPPAPAPLDRLLG